MVGNLVAEAAARCRAEPDIMWPRSAVISITGTMPVSGCRRALASPGCWRDPAFMRSRTGGTRDAGERSW